MTKSEMQVSLDGITPLPRGHIATIKSYLECRAPHAASVPSAPPPFHLTRLTGADEPRYRALFRTIGTRWLWWSRLMMTPPALAQLLDQPQVEAYAMSDENGDIGLLEWDFTRKDAPELAFLGLIDRAIGQGFGPAAMQRTQQRMFSVPINCIRVNTCTLDHPAALAFYHRHGFDVVSQAIEIVPDPRLAGLLPETAAPHIPLLR